MKRILTFTLLLSALTMSAQEDITSKYLQNPSFEQDDISTLSAVNNSSDGLRGYTCTNPTKWAVSGTSVTELIVTKDCFTDNNFGKVTTLSDGNQAYYLRMGWSTGSTTVSQSIKLPAGKYKLTVDTRSGYVNGATSTMNLKAGTETTSISFESGSTNCFTTQKWTTNEITFTLTSESEINIGADLTWKSGGSCIMLDNFRLYDMKDYVEPADPTEAEVTSPTEGTITADFVPEAAMKGDLLQMLANFSKYMVNDFQECAAPNNINEACGAFRGENTMGNNEQGVRPNADLSMICAFLVKYGKPAGVTLPSGVTWDKIEDMAMKSLIFAYSTHKANKLKVCSGNNYWGSVSTSDYAWESSLWAMSVAYSAYFQWDKLSDAQKNYIYQLLKAECNYELGRSIPTGYNGDTKAEENGWEVDILAATLGLFPDDALAPKWFERMREFAINSYSHPSDASNTTVIDPAYNSKTVADLYKGQNLYDDYTLQNHNLFHTSYQNVVMQELGEAALALKMFQLGVKGEETWKSNALMHHNQEVMDSVLNWLALADGELAMPNGNDWSLFLYDQITSYTTQACFQRDANALMLENLAYKYIKARQNTTSDGSWLLRADVGARRMGVEAHRVMMTYLMHEVLSTADLTPTSWDEFSKQHSEAKILPCQNVVRASSDHRFTTFSWSNGLKSYTGYIAANNPDKNKIIVPFRANNTGNFLGWYEVSGKGTNATPVVSGIYQLKGNSYVMNGELNTNDNTLNNRFAIYSTPGNAVIYLDHVTAKTAATITAEKGGLMAISVDDMTKLARTLYYNKDEEITHKQLDGTTFTQLSSSWVNIDNSLGIVGSNDGKKVAFGDRSNNNSIMTAKVYPMYSNASRTVKQGEVVDARNLVYYSNINATDTKDMADALVSLRSTLPAGWNGVIASDDHQAHMLISNFAGNTTAEVSGIQFMGWAPVMQEETTITDSQSSVKLQLAQNNSYAQPVKVMVQGSGIVAKLDTDNSAYITATQTGTCRVGIAIDGHEEPAYLNELTIKKGETVRVYLNEKDEVCAESAAGFPETQKDEDLTSKIVNPSFDGDTANGWSGTTPSFQTYTDAEFFNKTFDFHQVIEGLKPGLYQLGVQAFYRDGLPATAATKHNSGTESLNAILYANEAETPLVSIFTDAGNNYKIGISTAAGYVPDNMEQAASYFRNGLYHNTLIAEVTEDGTLTIGIRKTKATTNDWTIFDNFTLRYLGTDEEVGITQPTILNPQPSTLNPTTYNLQGIPQTNSNLTPGIYITAGKKQIIR